jgi:hypothetical protein
VPIPKQTVFDRLTEKELAQVLDVVSRERIKARRKLNREAHLEALQKRAAWYRRAWQHTLQEIDLVAGMPVEDSVPGDGLWVHEGDLLDQEPTEMKLRHLAETLAREVIDARGRDNGTANPNR